jgi:hypothetical protein
MLRESDPCYVYLCYKNLYQIRAQWLKIKIATDSSDYQFSKNCVNSSFYQAHNTQTTVEPEN